MIYAYHKHIDAIRTVEINLPVNGTDRLGTELATINGITYVFVPDPTELPDQPIEIDVAPVALTDAMRDQIKATSPHVRLINQQVEDKIRERYSPSDEIKLLRIAPSEETSAWNTYVEECRAWGRGKKAELGL